MVTEDGVKAVDPKVLERSIIETPPVIPGAAAPPAPEWALLWMLADATDEIPAWGTQPKQRDLMLRAFIGTESIFTSALGVVCSRNAGFSWTVNGAPRTAQQVKVLLDGADQGRGWEHLIVKTSIDLYTQDNGTFWELVRQRDDSPDASVIAINHLDAARCWHTGNPLKPVVYQDRLARYHLLDWWNVAELTELPAPVEGRYGLQYCALTRLLLAARVLRNVAIYKQEKTGGRHNKAIHFVSGIAKREIEDAIAKYQVFADAQGLQRYSNPIIVGAIDPKAKVETATLELASLPDGFDEEKVFKQYIAQIAMAFLSDYQDFAPLPGGNLGTSAQSEILHMKARGKGPALFMNTVARVLNSLVLPRNVEFCFEEQDMEAEKTEAEIRKLRVETRKMQVDLGEITAEESRQMAVDAGDLPKDIFEASGDVDVTEDIEVESQEQLKERDSVRPHWITPPARWYD